jgi:hypothetical protein
MRPTRVSRGPHQLLLGLVASETLVSLSLMPSSMTNQSVTLAVISSTYDRRDIVSVTLLRVSPCVSRRRFSTSEVKLPQTELPDTCPPACSKKK